MTMPATAPAPATTAAPATPAARPTTHDRAAALKERLETAPDDGGAVETGAVEQSAGGTPAQPAAAAPTDVQKRAADRLARIEQVRAKERADDDARQKREKHKDQSGELEKLRAKVAQLEPQNDIFTSEEALLAEAEKRGMSAEKLIQWMRTRLMDPAAVAQRHAKSEADKIREELAKDREELNALKKQLSERDQQTREQFEAQQKTQQFIAQAEQRAAEYPLTAAMMKRHGPNAFVKWANTFVAPLLPEGYNLDQLHDYSEQLLDELQLGGPIPQPQQPANGASPPPKKNGAAEPATTLSNALASERLSVTEEVPLHRLSREERRRRLKDKLERE